MRKLPIGWKVYTTKVNETNSIYSIISFRKDVGYYPINRHTLKVYVCTNISIKNIKSGLAKVDIRLIVYIFIMIKRKLV